MGLRETGSEQDRPRTSSEFLFNGRAFNVRVDTVTKSSGSMTVREIVEHPDSVAIVVVDERQNVLLERQFRHATGKELLEVPAGGIEPGESADECVRRELREEIGYLPRRIKRIGGFYSAPGFCTEYLHLYLATDLEYSPLQASDTAEISLERVPLDDVAGLISSGQIEDAKSIAGLLTAMTFHMKDLRP
ncbi:MAG: NUDIX hydrolase [Chloroflexi bacterium]|nr:NUDIX hydrolase [Chloroflexota bacterium]